MCGKESQHSSFPFILFIEENLIHTEKYPKRKQSNSKLAKNAAKCHKNAAKMQQIEAKRRETKLKARLRRYKKHLEIEKLAKVKTSHQKKTHKRKKQYFPVPKRVHYQNARLIKDQQSTSFSLRGIYVAGSRSIPTNFSFPLPPSIFARDSFSVSINQSIDRSLIIH